MTNNKMKTYITYGKGDKFDINKLPPKELLDTRQSVINKVGGAFWGSPVDADFGWKDWCENENFCTHLLTPDNCFKWTLNPMAKVLYIEEMEDLDKVPFIESEYGLPSMLYVDFKTIVEEYDAMEICMDKYYFGHMFKSEKEICFNSWDCDSIMVFNRDMIIPINQCCEKDICTNWNSEDNCCTNVSLSGVVGVCWMDKSEHEY